MYPIFCSLPLPCTTREVYINVFLITKMFLLFLFSTQCLHMETLLTFGATEQNAGYIIDEAAYN
jgi:hypothetical protein